MALPKAKEFCPVCNTEMNTAPEARDMRLCPECGTHTKDGEIQNLKYNGDLEKVGHMKRRLKVVEGKPQTIDFYFDSKDKKQFKQIVGMSFHPAGWMVLIKADGKQVLINKDKVNFVEET
jgi:Zn-finger nucleic acid-binding protein